MIKVDHKFSFLFFLSHKQVSRIDAKTDEEETELILDYNTDIYSLKVNDRFALVLATSLGKKIT